MQKQTTVYNERGWVVTEKDGNDNEIRYDYDPSGRVASVMVFAFGATQPLAKTTYQYDAAGNVTEKRDGVSVWKYTRNAAGQALTEKVYESDGTTLVSEMQYQYTLGGYTDEVKIVGKSITRYTHDANGQVLTEKVYEWDGATLVRDTSYDYNQAGQLVEGEEPRSTEMTFSAPCTRGTSFPPPYPHVDYEKVINKFPTTIQRKMVVLSKIIPK